MDKTPHGSFGIFVFVTNVPEQVVFLDQGFVLLLQNLVGQTGLFNFLNKSSVQVVIVRIGLNYVVDVLFANNDVVFFH